MQESRLAEMGWFGGFRADRLGFRPYRLLGFWTVFFFFFGGGGGGVLLANPRLSSPRVFRSLRNPSSYSLATPHAPL